MLFRSVSSREHSLVPQKSKLSIDVSGTCIGLLGLLFPMIMPLSMCFCRYLSSLDIEPFCRQVQDFDPRKDSLLFHDLEVFSPRTGTCSCFLRGTNAESNDLMTTSIEAASTSCHNADLESGAEDLPLPPLDEKRFRPF